MIHNLRLRRLIALNAFELTILPFVLSALSMGRGQFEYDAINSETRKKIEGIKSKHHRILIIDNDDAFRGSMSFNLKRKYGAQVEDVESGKAGIEKLQNGSLYDLIFVDIMMPEMTGIETYRELRKTNAAVKIAIMSAYSSSKEWKEAETLPGSVLLHKPISQERMIEILEWIEEGR